MLSPTPSHPAARSRPLPVATQLGLHLRDCSHGRAPPGNRKRQQHGQFHFCSLRSRPQWLRSQQPLRSSARPGTLRSAIRPGAPRLGGGQRLLLSAPDRDSPRLAGTARRAPLTAAAQDGEKATREAARQELTLSAHLNPPTPGPAPRFLPASSRPPPPSIGQQRAAPRTDWVRRLPLTGQTALCPARHRLADADVTGQRGGAAWDGASSAGFRLLFVSISFAEENSCFLKCSNLGRSTAPSVLGAPHPVQ